MCDAIPTFQEKSEDDDPGPIPAMRAAIISMH